MEVHPPEQPGQYTLELDMLQEGVSWFKDKGSQSARLAVNVVLPGRLPSVAQHEPVRPQRPAETTPGLWSCRCMELKNRWFEPTSSGMGLRSSP